MVVVHIFDAVIVVVDPRNLPPTVGQIKPHQNLPKGSDIQSWNLALRLNSQNESQMTTFMDGHLPSQGWSPPTQGWSPTRRKCSTDMEFGT